MLVFENIANQSNASNIIIIEKEEAYMDAVHLRMDYDDPFVYPPSLPSSFLIKFSNTPWENLIFNERLDLYCLPEREKNLIQNDKDIVKVLNIKTTFGNDIRNKLRHDERRL